MQATVEKAVVVEVTSTDFMPSGTLAMKERQTSIDILDRVIDKNHKYYDIEKRNPNERG